MKVFRLSKKKYSEELSGKGAAKFGNRWNSKGTEMIYSAESRALEMAEVAVHLSIATLPSDFVMMEIDIPNDIKVKILDSIDLPDYWNVHPPNSSTQKLGDSFIDEMDFCVFKVPSVVVQGDFNYLINPYHKQFKKIKIVEISNFPFDRRMFV